MQPETTAAKPSSRQNWFEQLALAGLLAGLTLAVYLQLCWYDFINFDDEAHVYQNPHVVSGLSLQNLIWAFEIHGPSQWHPLSWISHQLDCQFFGLNAGGHHATNLAMHVASAVLLYLAIWRLTGTSISSAMVAVLFAIHPLNVESVAWISERRNVLCALFWMLTLLAYAEYARKGGRRWYLTVFALHAAALMAKPLAVTLPCVLMLLDVWPLNRVIGWQFGPLDATRNVPHPSTRRSFRSLILEKIPLLALSLIASVLTTLCQESAGAIAELDKLPMSTRTANAFVVYGIYLRKMVWPVDLGVFYPHPALMRADGAEALVVPAIASAVFLALVTIGAIWLRRTRPWLAIGWFWYLGTLVPMIGLFQVGEQQLADRYAYIPMIGLFLAVTWEASLLVQKLPLLRPVIGVAGCAVVAALSVTTFLQAAAWQNSITIYNQTLAVNQENHWAHNNLGLAYSEIGEADLAAAHYSEAIRYAPEYALAHYNLGVLLHDYGQRNSARGEFERAIELEPNNADAHVRLGALLGEEGDLAAARQHFQLALEAVSDHADAHMNLGVVLGRLGEEVAAIEHFQAAVAARPLDQNARVALAIGFASLGKWNDANQTFEKLIALAPEEYQHRMTYGSLLFQQQKFSEAAAQFQAALVIRPGDIAAQRELRRSEKSAPMSGELGSP